jgi:hypothetical protein
MKRMTRGWLLGALLVGIDLIGMVATARAQYGGITPNAPYDQSRRVARRTARRTTRRNTAAQQPYETAPPPYQQQAPSQPMPPQQPPAPPQQPAQPVPR